MNTILSKTPHLLGLAAVEAAPAGRTHPPGREELPEDRPLCSLSESSVDELTEGCMPPYQYDENEYKIPRSPPDLRSQEIVVTLITAVDDYRVLVLRARVQLQSENTRRQDRRDHVVERSGENMIVHRIQARETSVFPAKETRRIIDIQFSSNPLFIVS